MSDRWAVPPVRGGDYGARGRRLWRGREINLDSGIPAEVHRCTPGGPGRSRAGPMLTATG